MTQVNEVSMAQRLYEFVGQVVEIPSRKRAIIQFQLETSIERALLFCQKLRIHGNPIPKEGVINEFITVGTILRFVCHEFDDTKKDRCGWFVISAWQELVSEMGFSNVRQCHGLYNRKGTICQVTKRQGYLMYEANGVKELVVFLASHVYLSSKRLCVRTSLQDVFCFKPGHTVNFDAVPCDPEDNKNGCRWFAMAVWKGEKPLMAYDRPPLPPLNRHIQLPEIKRITSDPQSLFLIGDAKIATVLGSEYAVAVCNVSLYQQELVLFHRSSVAIFGYCLANTDLQTMFKQDDRIRVIAAAVPIGWPGPRWVASRVSVPTDPAGAAAMLLH